jgi:hypothetical protein
VIDHAHLLEERLFDCYLAERTGERIDPPAAEHLADCEPCAARYRELAAFMDALKAEGEAETDAVFTADRLRSQHDRVMQRLVNLGHRARVIRFPQQVRRPVDFVRRSMTTSTSHGSSRWIAAAAAAGLFVGVAVGASYNYGGRGHQVEQALARQTAAPRLTPAATLANTPAPAALADDAFLSDLELALERPHTRELMAFDAFTPHAREVGLQR